MSSSIASRIGKLLAKAENTSSTAEAAALFEKAQQLASQHSVELAVARRMHSCEQPTDVVEERTLYIGEPRTTGLKQKVTLWGHVATANDLQWAVRSDSSLVFPIGFGSDLDSAETLYGVLAEQMVRLCNECLAVGEWRRESYLDWDNDVRPMTSRVARRLFYEGFTEAVGVRLTQARSSAVAAAEAKHHTRAGGTRGALSVTTLALRDKATQVNDFKEAAFKRRGVRGIYRGSRAVPLRGGTAHTAGLAAGAHASMSTVRALA